MGIMYFRTNERAILDVPSRECYFGKNVPEALGHFEDLLKDEESHWERAEVNRAA